MSKAPAELTGRCQCGQFAYTITGNIYSLNICHCLDCQRQSGSAFGMSLVIDPAAFHIRSGTLHEFKTGTDSGRTKTCAFCPDCGVRIYNRTSTLMSIKAGTLSDTSWLTPDAHYWTKRKQSWTPLATDVPCFEKSE